MAPKLWPRIRSTLFRYPEIDTMKNRLHAVVVAAVLAVPAIASAQPTHAGLTRAQVRADLAQLESAGYNPHRGPVSYPADIEAAEAKLRISTDASRDVASSLDADTRNGSAQTGS